MSQVIKKLILCYLPNNTCNLRCSYCYITQSDRWEKPKKLEYSYDYIRKCFSRERLEGTCLINLTANGETLLHPDVELLVKAFLDEGHFVEIVTNGVLTNAIDRILDKNCDNLAHLFFKISFHYTELVNKNLLEVFWNNVKKIKSSGSSFTIELMPNDDLENEIDSIKKICIEQVGAYCHLTVGRNDSINSKPLLSKHPEAEYRCIWGGFESKMFDFKMDILGKKNRSFCYAGDWSYFVNLYSGDVQGCYWQPVIQNIYENPEEKLKSIPIGGHCKLPYCVNAHAHMAWGIIPEKKTPYYNEIRNKKCSDGSEWIVGECKEFFCTKLYDCNEQYSLVSKKIKNILYYYYAIGGILGKPKESWERVERYLKRKKNG
ncbi:radical SAM protein [Butyrivibrio sp. INlla14]|uniref:radical SAM protein n=1 Tax=Butyrivibrio sp. INlla14 TaxID=1520808 RepID=UPI000876ADBA|nr:radical SAM protein [Butyrivibrio sp. INlla14]SCY42586.1 Organic radical activating enzyme [Butyrivibrio sp. INlla14]